MGMPMRARRPVKPPRRASGLLGLLVMVVGTGAPGLAQSAQVSELQAVSTNVTYVLGGGFAIISDGSLLTDSPLNAITTLTSVTGARLVINDRVLLDGVPDEVQTIVDSGQARSNNLSPELVSSRIDVAGREAVVLGIGGRVSMPTALGGSLETLRSVAVGGESFSVFPGLLPSVFTRELVTP